MFNENNVVLNLGVLSDIHISGIWGMEMREANFKKYLAMYKQMAGGHIDAFLFNGDFTDAMNSKPNVVISEAGFSRDYDEARAIQTANEFRIIRSAFATIDDDTDIVYTLGNHDGCNNNNIERFITEFSSRDEIGDNKNFERMYRTDTDLDAMRRGVRHCVVCGYHILCLDMFTDYTEPLEFIRAELDKVTSAEPEKYVFVMFHCKTPDTVFESNGWGSCPKLGELLKNYPQVVLITGHTHSPLQNERAIWQGEYTAVEGSCMDYILNSNSAKEQNVTHNMHYSQSQGLLMQLDGEGNLKITRLDLKKSCEIRTPWVLPAPKADGSHLKLYTNKRAELYPAPEFPHGAEITLRPEEDKTYIEFPAAHHPDMVFRYEVAVTDSMGKTELFYLSSLFCYENPTPDKVSGTLPCSFNRVYRISVTPQDIWFKCGKPINLNIV